MALEAFETLGCCTGEGHGQRYEKQEDGRWLKTEGVTYGEVRTTDGAIWGMYDRWVFEGKIWIKVGDWPEAKKHGWEATETDDNLVCVRRTFRQAAAIRKVGSAAHEMPI